MDPGWHQDTLISLPLLALPPMFVISIVSLFAGSRLFLLPMCKLAHHLHTLPCHLHTCWIELKPMLTQLSFFLLITQLGDIIFEGRYIFHLEWSAICFVSLKITWKNTCGDHRQRGRSLISMMAGFNVCTADDLLVLTKCIHLYSRSLSTLRDLIFFMIHDVELKNTSRSGW